MAHEIFDRNDKSERSSDRSFGLVFSSVFIVIALAPLLSCRHARWWALIPAGAFLLTAFLCPSLLSGLNRGWTKIGHLLHRIVSPLLLAMFFFLILTPFAIIMRMFRKDELSMDQEPASNSYWVTRKKKNTSTQNMSNQF